MQDMKDKGISAEINWASPWMGGATLPSITASRDWQAINGLDYDFSTADILYRNPDEAESSTGFKTLRQAFRLSGEPDGVDCMVVFFSPDRRLERPVTDATRPTTHPYRTVART